MQAVLPHNFVFILTDELEVSLNFNFWTWGHWLNLNSNKLMLFPGHSPWKEKKKKNSVVID